MTRLTPHASALVHIGVEALDLAGPVDFLLDHRPGWPPPSRLRRGALGLGSRRPHTGALVPPGEWRQLPCVGGGGGRRR